MQAVSVNVWKASCSQNVINIRDFKFLVVVIMKFTVYWGRAVRLLARSRYSEGPATGHLDTGFSRFPCVYK